MGKDHDRPRLSRYFWRRKWKKGLQLGNRASERNFCMLLFQIPSFLPTFLNRKNWKKLKKKEPWYLCYYNHQGKNNSISIYLFFTFIYYIYSEPFIRRGSYSFDNLLSVWNRLSREYGTGIDCSLWDWPIHSTTYWIECMNTRILYNRSNWLILRVFKIRKKIYINRWTNLKQGCEI